MPFLWGERRRRTAWATSAAAGSDSLHDQFTIGCDPCFAGCNPAHAAHKQVRGDGTGDDATDTAAGRAQPCDLVCLRPERSFHVGGAQESGMTLVYREHAALKEDDIGWVALAARRSFQLNRLGDQRRSSSKGRLCGCLAVIAWNRRYMRTVPGLTRINRLSLKFVQNSIDIAANPAQIATAPQTFIQSIVAAARYCVGSKSTTTRPRQ